MSAWPKNYQKIQTVQANPEPLDVWLSPDVQDLLWDNFLRSTPCGQYQQSGMWADYKAGEGWQHHRVIVTNATEIVGGFQILWKKSRWVRMGYVSKGPVAHPEEPSRVLLLKTLLCKAARALDLTILIAQDPDDALQSASTAEALGFIASNPARLIETTYLVDVSDDMEIVRKRMSKSLQRNIRKAQTLGVAIREGTESDLPLFHRLMTASCIRQNTSPNPRDMHAFRRLWQAFAPTHSIRLTFAEREGTIPAGRICLIFGNRTTHWKKGWDGSHPNWCAAALLDDASFEWAHSNGSKVCDFCSISRVAALAIREGKEIPAENISTSDQFKLRYGGYPKILPSAYIYLPNPLLRWAYRIVYPILEKYRNRASKSKSKTLQAGETDNT